MTRFTSPGCSTRRLAQAGVRLRAPGPQALTEAPAYPRPLVDAAQAARSARARMGDAQRQEASRQSRRVLIAHGSRKTGGKILPQLKNGPWEGPFQGELFYSLSHDFLGDGATFSAAEESRAPDRNSGSCRSPEPWN